MPRANEGTLLENIVLVEAARFLSEVTTQGETIEFLNSFVMPPLSEWRSKEKDNGMTTEALKRVATAENAGDGYSGLMKRSLNFSHDVGPNGALLAALTFKLNQRQGRFWLNDLEESQTRYQDEQFSLGEVESVAASILSQTPSNWQVQVCHQHFPNSLNGLSQTLSQWQGAAARLGYLDPDFFSPKSRDDDSPQTDSASVRHFLEILGEGFVGPVLSVHFTCHQMGDELAKQVEGLKETGIAAGFESCHFMHRRFAVVVHSANVPHEFQSAFAQRVNDSWAEWGRIALLRKKPYVLHSFIGKALV